MGVCSLGIVICRQVFSRSTFEGFTQLKKALESAVMQWAEL